ncbi:MAG: TetR family transcriptional regulator [Haloechinothrix sp.]
MGAEQRMRTPRRAPAAAERGKVAERTRERIVQAAVEEFGAQGYAGARTAGIAARAGVNPQLISYYFGGKQGLLEELRRRWGQTETALAPPDATFAESVAAYLDATLDRPSWARLVIWQALGDHPDDAGQQVAAQREKLSRAVQRIRRRQGDGELTGDVEAEFILLLAHIVAFAPIAMPQIVEAIYGIDPLSTEYRQRCQEALLSLVNPERSVQ